MECPLYLGDRAVGTVRWRREGARLELDVSCTMEPGYIYRPELLFSGARRVLGVMLPENGRFRLRKNLAAPDEPCSARILRTLPGEQALPPLPFPFSYLTPWEPAKLVRDELFLRLCPARALAAEENGLRWLMLPFEPEKETPLAPFLCVVAPLRAGGKSWALFCADENVQLCPPPPSDTVRAAGGL